MAKRNFLLHVIKDKKHHGRRDGVIVAVGPGKVGWSKVNYKDGDKFDLNQGIITALVRAANPEIDDAKLPDQYQKFVDIMTQDSEKYWATK